MLKYVVWRIIVKLKNTKDMEEWIDLGQVNTDYRGTPQRTCHYTLYMRIIDGEKYYKVDGEHVKVMDKELRTTHGFAYNAVSPSYYIYIV